MFKRLLNLGFAKQTESHISKPEGEYAGCYFVNGRLIIHTVSKTTAGIALAENPTIVPIGDRQAIGSAVLQALSASGTNTTDAIGGISQFAPFLKAAGVRSYKAFMTDAICLDIEKRDNNFTISRWENEGARNGFAPSSERPCELTDPTIDLLGAYILYALGLTNCEAVLAAMGGIDPTATLPPRNRSDIS